MTDQSETISSNWFSQLAHPGMFMRWSAYLIWPLGLLSIVLFAVGLWFAFFHSPADYQMGETVRIMYVHVPNAWLSQFCYGLMAVSAVGTLVWRHPMADVSMKAAAPLGAAFTAMALVTGSLWGRPTWGTFWEWDGRMTSTLILFLIYLGLIALWRTFEDQLRAAKVVAVLTLVGAVNIPIIKFSVDWWNTLHQPSTFFRADGPKAPASIITPLLTMTLAFTVLFLLLHLLRMRTEVTKRKADRLEHLKIARQQKGA
ncbi:MAG: heme ABC transporter permease [Hyphomicrobiaceae bacterium]|nr:heme ABC transporter permease [Hyphomicrobiaceae bacterium]